MVDIVLRQGDELPVIYRTFTIDGAPVDLTTASGGVNFVVYAVDDLSTPLFTHAATVVDAVNGDVKYGLTTDDSGSLAAGFYAANFVADFTGSKTLTAPNDGFITIQITSMAEGLATYTGDPLARPIDTIRFLSRDTDMSNPRLTDAEIGYFISIYQTDVYSAAADCAETSAGTYATYQDKTVGPLSVRYGEQAQRFLTMATNLRARAGRQTGFAPVSTQYSEDHIFALGMHDAITYSGSTPALNDFFEVNNPLIGEG